MNIFFLLNFHQDNRIPLSARRASRPANLKLKERYICGNEINKEQLFTEKPHQMTS
jgi:hypothetical protein